MIELTQGRSKGQWWPCLPNTATVYCPDCGRPFSLPHKIAADGTVTPSVVCGYSGLVECPEKCGFHGANVRLVGWSEWLASSPKEKP